MIWLPICHILRTICYSYLYQPSLRDWLLTSSSQNWTLQIPVYSCVDMTHATFFHKKKLFTKQFWSYVATRASVCGVNCDSCINYFSTTLTNCTQQKVYIFVKRAKDYTYNQKQYNSWTCKQTHNNTKRWECHETNSYNKKTTGATQKSMSVSSWILKKRHRPWNLNNTVKICATVCRKLEVKQNITKYHLYAVLVN